MTIEISIDYDERWVPSPSPWVSEVYQSDQVVDCPKELWVEYEAARKSAELLLEKIIKLPVRSRA
jgi:hypothetical protein